MKVYYIVSLMVITLIILFVFLPRFRNREIDKNKLEVNYFEKLKEANRSGNSFELVFNELKLILSKVYDSSDEEILKSRLQRDLNAFGDKK